MQLHGDEPPEVFDELAATHSVIRAFRCQDSLAPIREYLDKCLALPVAVLVDAYDPDEYGGTGKTLHWPDIASASDYVGQIPLILAGGLTPSNVARAIQVARPHGVDVASGVEVAPGRKDDEKCRVFIDSARAAFSA